MFQICGHNHKTHYEHNQQSYNKAYCRKWTITYTQHLNDCILKFKLQREKKLYSLL